MRRAGGGDGLGQPDLGRGQGDVGGVAGLAFGAFPGEPQTRPAQGQHDDVGLARGGHGSLDRLVAQIAGEGASGLGANRVPAVRGSRPRASVHRTGPGPDCVRPARWRCAVVPGGHHVVRAVHGAELAPDDRLVRLTPGGVGIGRELQRRRVRMRADDGDVETVRCQREDAVVLGQHDRASGQLLGQVAALLGRRCDVDPLGRVGMLEEADLELRPQHPPDAAVDVPDVDGARVRPRRPARRRTRTGWASRRRGPPRWPAGRRAPRRRRPAALDELIDGGVVGGDEAVEPEGVAQQVLQDLRRAHRRGCRRHRRRSSSPTADRRGGSPPRRGRRTGPACCGRRPRTPEVFSPPGGTA